jgi:hypothetical protein
LNKLGAVWSPTIFINGKNYCLYHTADCESKVDSDFVKKICDEYKGKNQKNFFFKNLKI